MIKYEYVIVSKNRNDGELFIDTTGLAGITLPVFLTFIPNSFKV